MSDRIVGDVAAVNGDGFPVEVVCEGCVRARRITKRSRGDRYACDEVFVQLAFKPESDANSSTVAIRSSILKKAFTADAHVTSQTKPAHKTLQRTDAFLVVLSLKCIPVNVVRTSSKSVETFCERRFLLVVFSFDRCILLLCFGGGGLSLLKLLLRLC